MVLHQYPMTPPVVVYRSPSGPTREKLWLLKSENGEAVEQATQSECHPTVPLQEYL